MKNSKNGYFEGWYFKHQNAGHTVSIIPALHIDPSGSRSASIQFITEEASYNAVFPAGAYSVCRSPLQIKLGNCLFSESGITAAVNTTQFSASGRIGFGPLTPLQRDIMGPFRFLPFMQCRHGVLSLRHSLEGSLTINGKSISFTGGSGYIERDWGASFPDVYLWTQCNGFGREPCSIIASAASIPLGPACFTGIICSILYKGTEYRIATYNGARVVKWGPKELVLRQGKYSFSAELLSESAHALRAPVNGRMVRMIRESPSATVRYIFSAGTETIFDLVSDAAGFEYAKPS